MSDGANQTFWFNGLPLDGIQNSNDTGTLKFWFNGLPVDVIYGGTTPVTPVVAGTKVLDTSSPVIMRRVIFNAY